MNIGANLAVSRRACIISLTNVVQEPRVLRQIRTLQERGWTVAVVGYSRGVQVPDSWEFIEAQVDENLSQDARRIRHLIFSNPSAAVRRIILIMKYKGEGLAHKFVFRSSNRRWSLRKAGKYFKIIHGNKYLVKKILNGVRKCDLVIAHDYFTYLLAEQLVRRDKAKLVIDCHEYAMEQYDYGSHHDPDIRRRWLYVTRPYIDTLQRHFFHRADAVSTVCVGIAELLKSDYGLPKSPAVIRSTPFYEEFPFRPCGDIVNIVYHGLISPSRNLDLGIRALSLCRPEFRLILRGPVEPGYGAELLGLARKLDVQHRVDLLPPVPFSELVRSASEADIGYFVFNNFSRQRQFTSPNKFFEYIMAGLSLVVSDVPELARVINHYRNGILVPNYSVEAVAAAINGLDRESIDSMKKRSLDAAKELCWEREQQRLVEAYDL